MRKQRASYWKYTGNHHRGKDYGRYDPHGYGVDNIAFLAYCADTGSYLSPDVLDKVKVTHHRGDDFGHEVSVSAPKEVWEIAIEENTLVSLSLSC